MVPFTIMGQTFHLKGNFTGKNTEELILSYHNESDNPVIDTLEIKNGKFETNGTVGGVQRVYLRGNTTSNEMEDPNLGYFFLEPGEILISLEENNFKEIEVNGSTTQREFKKLDEGQAIIRKEIDDISKKISALRKSSTGSKNQEQRKLQDQWLILLDKLRDINIQYSYNNPDSFLSPYLINFYKRDIPKDSLNSLYTSLTPKVKNTIYAEAIRKQLGAKVLDSGSKAINFTSTDFNGNEISLDDFKGNYVLLDFWAGWCKPCLENHPTLKEIYNQYKKKGFKIIGVSFDEDEDKWKESIRKENLDIWQHIFVGLDKVRMNGSISNLYGVQPIPAYILIDKEGVIVDRYLAADSKRKSLSDLRKKLKELID
jgi:thiol-disulfide isomerase/thioredoxin